MNSAVTISHPGAFRPGARALKSARARVARGSARKALRVRAFALTSKKPSKSVDEDGRSLMSDPLSAMMNFISEMNPLASVFKSPSDKLHVHFGAGRLGFGLVIPALESSGSPYIVMNRPSAVWAPVVEREKEAQQHVAVKINGECTCGGRGLHVITEDDIRAHEEGILGIVHDALENGARGFLLLSMDVNLCAPVIAQATSFSCALGPAVQVLADHLMNLPDVEDETRPVLYACENDHSSVEKLQFALRTKVEAVPCMVDRICVDLTVSDDAKTVNVTAEGHEGSIVVLNQPESADGKKEQGPLAGDFVQNPENEADSSYLYRKKLLTVNGMHTVIAFRTLCSYASTQRNFSPPESCLALPLLSDETVTDEQRAEIWSWGVAQVLVLMWEHGIPTMMRVHGQDTTEGLVNILLDQLRTTLDRFFTIEDSTARVLGGGVSLRYEGRLLPTYETITNELLTAGWTPDCAQNVLLKQAGLELESLQTDLQMLVDEARPFAAVDKRARAMKELEEAMKEEQARSPHTGPHTTALAWEAVGLPPVEEVRAKFQESFEIIQVCNTARAGFGLRPIELCREEHKTLKEKQKAETLEALANLAKTNDGVVKSLNFLKVSGFKFAISTTSPKSRVIACLDTMRLADDFPQEKIHSGSSDFDPPRFKPAPDVYLKAAAAEEVGVEACIAVEDSLSGVGSAADAGVALIVGYVGGGHITAEALDGYAEALLAGGKSKNGRGADVVIRDMEDLPSVVNTFLDMRMDDPTTCDRDHFDFEKIRPALRDRCWTTAGKTGVVEVEDPNPR
ncbi:uncharacterized protein MICPUCDRAFT_48208 [Micromonas pusilla CCMP1545]|uniref:Predicted protein n=1 Tax=Micromonas pusilla (strain CCMP1545) TaxID=564608 RepID=C1N0F1_MICPC|nr:uncharacterized protein MICPUCDRAFT_48208 [Micromonas pusilla CCMP1545]EEH54256.1 predicted protein [Micromonas pusilla CCMP1545]|eukprot:XP_003061626.1 predicted protein [Micromonas pusilla CCMP1545]